MVLSTGLSVYYIWFDNYSAAVFITFNPAPSTASCISFLAIRLRTLESNSTSVYIHGHYYFRVLQIAAMFWHKGSYLVYAPCLWSSYSESATFAVTFRSLLQAALKLKNKNKEQFVLFLLAFCFFSFLSIKRTE